MRLPRNLALALSHWIATYATLAAFHLAIHPLKPHRGLLGAAFDYGVIAPLLGTWILLFSSLAELFSAPREPIIIWGTYLPVFLGTYYLLGPKRLTPIGKCPHCGYDLRASPTRCPECGAVREEEPLEHLLLK